MVVGRFVGRLLLLLAASFVLQAGTAFAHANPVATENELPGDSFWTIAIAPETSIAGYLSEVSAKPGDVVHLHVSVPSGDRYRVEIHRLGWYGGLGGRRVLCVPSCGGDEVGVAQPAPPPPGSESDSVLRADWTVTDTFIIGASWVSGYYVAEIVLTTGPDTGKSRRVPLVVREGADETGSAFVVQVPVNTWQAYNNWGGKSLYDWNSSESVAAKAVSFDRPYGAGSSQNLFSWEIQFVRFVEREGIDVSYVTDVDTDADPSLLLDHQTSVTAGHDEYWTKEMRDGFEAARAAGTNLLFMGGNTAYWQMRYADHRRTIVEYRSAVDDPIEDPALKTIEFRKLGRPECELLGVQYRFGRAEEPPRDYTVDNAALADPWLLGSGFVSGGMVADAVGYEWDSIEPGCSVPPLTRLFHYEGAPGPADAVRYTAESGARVFSSGSMQFSWSLDDLGGNDVPADPRVQSFMLNVLDDMRLPAPPEASGVVENAEVVVHFASEDPRVEYFNVYRRPTGTSESGADELVCSTPTGECRERPPGGSYVYSVAAVTRWGASSPRELSELDVENLPPTAVLGFAPESPLTNETVVLSGEQSEDFESPLSGFEWDLDADGVFETQGPEVTTTFAVPGPHVVSLRVTDGNGAEAVASTVVPVRPNLTLQDGQLEFVASPGHGEDIVIRVRPAALVIDAQGAVTAGPEWSCTAVGDGTHCTASETAQSVRAKLGDGNDEATVVGVVQSELLGGPGADVLTASQGADELRGGEGPDVLRGRRGADRLVGGTGRDQLFAGRGNDLLLPGLDGRRDAADGGPGFDVARLEASDRAISIERVR